MASAFGHALSGYALSTFFPKRYVNTVKVILLCIGCSIFPDADVLAFKFNIPYSHPFGHRGFTHSIFFAIVFAVIVRWVFCSDVQRGSRRGWLLVLLFFVCTASHGFLDAMTTGGRGVAFFGPFDNTRHFLPTSWRVIKVSPLSASRFFSEWGLQVIKSELVWIGIPSVVVIIFNWGRRIVGGEQTAN